ncbi:SAM-dependent methyltransferase [Microbacterium trichothecenolyticum]|uniref:SAM-dependent methyltransferase n=1 Tax=Microbacterium trichothecenolyticum TaxID=69370 RepID=UPI001C6E0191|nr:SAM-dependent methyltransferase [Microbacterium trichothecenolyticum]MBW9121426.1 SAM-dependent methyltransferase [Microbacterium trichothecenolyticum]
MTSISTTTADWLALRAPADDDARSGDLARELARLLAPGSTSAPLVLHDLGAGTGSMTRWLAPRLPGPQRWVLRDGDADIVEHLDLCTVVDAAGSPVVADIVVEHLASLPIDAFDGAAAVTASALLDVITEAEAAHVVAACVAAGTPVLFSLSVTGAVRLRPAERHGALERAIESAFNEHQRREASGRRMLGPAAVAVVQAAFADAGWNVRTAATPWRLARHDTALMGEWLDGWIGAAVEQQPELGPDAAGYRERRLAEAAAGRLRVTVSHEDLLAWPR